VEKIVLFLWYRKARLCSQAFDMVMSGENIFQAVKLEVSNEFDNLLKELSYEKVN